MHDNPSWSTCPSPGTISSQPWTVSHVFMITLVGPPVHLLSALDSVTCIHDNPSWSTCPSLGTISSQPWTVSHVFMITLVGPPVHLQLPSPLNLDSQDKRTSYLKASRRRKMRMMIFLGGPSIPNLKEKTSKKTSFVMSLFRWNTCPVKI